ncbi:exo-beta-1,3-glucanase [Panaeolus papilionaceus]|nr:exo-beta-1,3-glucanase [Panaeolus papilionaceus]
MFPTKLLVVPLILSSVIPTALSALTFGFPYGRTKVRGVNLGGWLVLESWITPSVFDATNDWRIVDEYTFCKYQSKSVASKALQKHWGSWITEKDFVAIKQAGLNHIRIPIGYWAFEVGPGEPYIQGALPWLYAAVDWARVHGLKIIVDLHGLPGSQNGQWHTNMTNIERSQAIVKRIATLFKDKSDVVTAVTPANDSPAKQMNRPGGYRGEDVLRVARQFYYDSYGMIRYPYGTSKQSNTMVILSDAFQGSAYWKNFMPYPQWDGVMIDLHHYQVFSDWEQRLTQTQHIQRACSMANQFAAGTLWQIVGEWAPAWTDCTNHKMYSKRGWGSRFDGSYPGSSGKGNCTGMSGKASGFSAEYKVFLRKFWEAQVITFEKAQGWIQWTWKAENSDEWSYQAGLANGWIPKNPTAYKYPTICG